MTTKMRDPRLPALPPVIWAPFGDLETAITIRSAFSARPTAEYSTDYGIGGVVFRFYVRGPFGAVDWELMTDWDLIEVQRGLRRRGLGAREPTAGPVTLHQAHQRYSYQEPQMECHTGVKPCYGDVSYLAGDDVFDRMVREGHDGVWGALGEWYFQLDPKKWDDADVERPSEVTERTDGSEA